MPYFITDSADGCSGWGVIKDDGELIGCHTTKSAAVGQMVAVSLSEGMEPGGERSMSTMETREFHVEDMELRNDGNTFIGYAAVFNSPSEPLPFTEYIAPGAFNRTLQSRNNIKMFVNHDDTMVLASTRSGTLRLAEDSRGLRAEADLPNTTAGNDLRELLATRVVDSMSFGFSVPRGGDEWSEDGQTRTLREVRLHEVSVVTGFPAYEGTSAMVRKLSKLATRTETNTEELASAINALQDGDLTEAQAGLLRNVVDQIAPTVTVDAEPSLVDLLRHRLDLAEKSI